MFITCNFCFCFAVLIVKIEKGNRMKRFILMAVFALVFITTSAQAADKGMYISGNLGVSIASDSDATFGGIDLGSIQFDPGFNIGGAIGYDSGTIRAEGEIAYHSWDIDTVVLSSAWVGCPCSGPISDSSSSALSFMANGYYDFHSTESALVPYLGVGVGIASIAYDIQGFTDSAAIFAYQFMAGMSYDISPKAALTAGYRYFSGTDADFDGVEQSAAANEFNVGARFMF